MGFLEIHFLKAVIVLTVYPKFFLAFDPTKSFSNESCNLQTVPLDIPLDTTLVNLGSNRIELIDWFPALTSLDTLRLTLNLLTSFPNLTSAAGTLRVLHVDYNRISQIDKDFLQALTSLNHLYLTGNRLTAEAIPYTTTPMAVSLLHLQQNPLGTVPRMGTLGATIGLLSLAWAGINNVHEEDFNQFPVIYTIYLSFNNLTSFPVLPRWPRTITQLDLARNPIPNLPVEELSKNQFTLINLSGTKVNRIPNFCHSGIVLVINWEDGSIPTPIQCDCHAIWGELSGAWGFTYPTCVGPAGLVGITLNTVPISHLVCQGTNTIVTIVDQLYTCIV